MKKTINWNDSLFPTSPSLLSTAPAEFSRGVVYWDDAAGANASNGDLKAGE
jgi:hypothetical protein